jgi:hypothetical protein
MQGFDNHDILCFFKSDVNIRTALTIALQLMSRRLKLSYSNENNNNCIISILLHYSLSKQEEFAVLQNCDHVET